MPALVDLQHRIGDQFGLRAVERGGALGETRQHVELCERGGGLLQGRQPGGQQLQQRVVEFFFASQRAIAGAQHLVLERLQLGRDEALGGLHGLPPQVLRGDAIGLAAIHLDEKSLHAIEAELEARQPAALAFAALEFQQKLLGVAAEQAQFVEFRVVARRDHAAVAQEMRRRLGERARQHGVLVAMVGKLARELLQQRRGRLVQDRTQGLVEPRQRRECRPQLSEIAWPRRAQRHARQNALQVADRPQPLGQRHMTRGLDQRRHGVVADPQCGVIAQGSMQPAPQQPSAHGGGRPVEYSRKRELGFAGEAFIEFEVAAGCRIHDERGIAFLGGDREQVRQRRLLRLADVGQQRARRGDTQGLVGAAKAREIARAELLGERSRRRFHIEMPGCTQAPGPFLAGAGARGWRQRAIRRQDFRGPQALEFRIERGRVVQFHDAEAACGQIEPREPETAVGAADAGEHIVAAFIQQRLVGDGAGGDDAHHLALHRALGLSRLAALFANRDRLSLADQLREIGVERDGGHAGHGDGRSGGGAALGQRDVQELRGAARIVEEHLVKIAHAIKQQHVGVLRLDAQVLLH